jgi:hypothetical protein
MWDIDILENRVAAMRDLPWLIPALVLVEFTDEDLDNLDAAAATDKYRTVLNAIVSRIEREAA